MIANFIVGILIMTVCLTIQSVVVSMMLRCLFILEFRKLVSTTLIGASFLLVAVLLVLLAGNLMQIAVWAALFQLYGEFETFAAALYHSMVNFTTLGYGDLVMSESRRLLGALEAANGVMMFGLTTSILFMILNSLIQRAWDERAAMQRAAPTAPDRPIV